MKKFETSLNITPFELFSRINPENGWIFLDSSLQNVPYSRYSIICVNPKLIISYKDNKLSVKSDSEEIIETSNPIEMIRQKFYELKALYPELRSDLNTFHIGFAGYFSYDFGMTIEKVKSTKPSTTNLPDIFLSFFDSVLLYDHLTQKYSVYSAGEPKELLDFIFKRLGTKKKSQFELIKTEIISNFTKEEYLETIKKVKEYLEHGDIYQLNLSHQLSCEIKEHPIKIYSRLRELNSSQFSALVCVNDNQWILSSSPELFIDLKNSKVITKPIKGTIRRGNSVEEDQKLKNELFESPKDSAELLMIVDLERNDLGKVCKAGSVKVNSLKKIETYASVHHLVSEIEGELAEDKDIFDLITAMFPGGSITGAPKKRAIEIIDELEKCKRGVYTGSIGYIDLSGHAMLNIAIRTIIFDHGKLFLNLGGGIVYDSNPENEFNETIHKGKKILESIGIII